MTLERKLQFCLTSYRGVCFLIIVPSKLNLRGVKALHAQGPRISLINSVLCESYWKTSTFSGVTIFVSYFLHSIFFTIWWSRVLTRLHVLLLQSLQAIWSYLNFTKLLFCWTSLVPWIAKCQTFRIQLDLPFCWMKQRRLFGCVVHRGYGLYYARDLAGAKLEGSKTCSSRKSISSSTHSRTRLCDQYKQHTKLF